MSDDHNHDHHHEHCDCGCHDHGHARVPGPPGEKAANEPVTIHARRRPVAFTTAVPGSKSLANRAVLLAGAAQGLSVLRGLPDGDDVGAALMVLADLGLDVDITDPDAIEVDGRDLDFPVREGRLNLRSSGTVGRFLPGLLAASDAGEWRLAATPQLAGRPLAPLLDALREWGARLVQEEPPAAFPLTVHGGGLKGGRVEVSAAGSSQFASGVMMAAPLAREPAEVVISDADPDETYIDMTLDLMRRFGVAAEARLDGATRVVTAAANQRYRGADLRIEPDYNGAIYFLAMPLVAGGRATVANLPAASHQPGRRFLAVLERLGATVTAGRDGVTVEADGSRLRGGFAIDMRAMAEMALTLGVLAVFADAPVTMTNLAHIRGHETDRLAALAALLGQVGVATEEDRDWIRVMPAPRAALANVTVDSRGDHRLVMSSTLLGLGGGGLSIANPGAVDKTFPDFFARVAAAGIELS